MKEKVKIIHKDTTNELFFETLKRCFCFVDRGLTFGKEEAVNLIAEYEDENIDTSKMKICLYQ